MATKQQQAQPPTQQQILDPPPQSLKFSQFPRQPFAQMENIQQNNINPRYSQLQTKNSQMLNQQQNPFQSQFLQRNTMPCQKIGQPSHQQSQQQPQSAQQSIQPQQTQQPQGQQPQNIYSKNSLLFQSGQKQQQQQPSQQSQQSINNASQDVPHRKSQSNDQAYQVQYKVGQTKIQNEKRPSQQQGIVQLQELKRNSRAQEETYQSQTFNLRQKQTNIMSPTNQHQENSLLFHSPMQKSSGQGQRVAYIQSPSMKQPVKVVNSSSGMGAQVNYTTTAAISSEMQQLKDSNQKLLARIQQIESEIQRGMSQEFLTELVQKIQMLNQLNQKLEGDNEKIQTQLNAPTKMKDELQKVQNERNQLQNNLKHIQNEIPIWRNRCEELEVKEQENDSEQIRELVGELENKVQGLINENERLNCLVRDKDELEKLKSQLSQLKRDESTYKSKIRDQEKKKTQNQKDQQERMNQQNEWQERINDLEEKVNFIVVIYFRCNFQLMRTRNQIKHSRSRMIQN